MLLEANIDSDGEIQSATPLPEEFQLVNGPLRKLLDWTKAQAQALAKRFEDRRNEGWVRECHGDMHLGNMLLEHDEVVIFDGIDFNPELRWIDVMNEIAFSVMDLADRNRPDYANRLLNTYLEHTGDYSGLDVLPFYRTYRALVRAKVAHLGWKQHESSETSLRQELAMKRQEYINLAIKLIEPKKPRLMITHGLSGSGKSFGTLGLVESLGAVRVRSDVERKRLAGLDRLENSQEMPKADLYSSASTEATYSHLAKCAERIITAGFPTILDATFLKARHRAMMRALAERLGVPYVILDFEATEEQLRERITNRLKQGADPSEANLDVLEQQIKTREPLTPEEQPFVWPVNSQQAKGGTP
jgi:predicted kinase